MTRTIKTKKVSNTTGLTAAETKEWSKVLNKAKKSKCTDLDKCAAAVEDIVPRSNATLVVGKEASSSAIYVDGIKITGVLHATLDINAETGYPVLHLELLNPSVAAG